MSRKTHFQRLQRLKCNMSLLSELNPTARTDQAYEEDSFNADLSVYGNALCKTRVRAFPNLSNKLGDLYIEREDEGNDQYYHFGNETFHESEFCVERLLQ